MTKYSYDTVSEAINDLTIRGYTTDFKLSVDEECLVCNKTATRLSPNEFEIDETYRFEGDTDPGDEMIIFAISSIKHDIKGIVVNAYGAYSDSSTAKIVELLHNHIKTKPIKRNEFLIPISREHHHSLLLCWKIRSGIKKNVEISRIKKYVNWFYEYHILPHFEVEEKYIFPILGNENDLIKRAITEHENLKMLFVDLTENENKYIMIADNLDNHIRFEERILFNEIQSIATQAQLEVIQTSHSEGKFYDNEEDKFWV
jgi:hypothetical protein